MRIWILLEFIFLKANYSRLADSHPKRPLHGAERAEFAPGHFASI